MKVRPFHHQRPLAALAAAYGAGVWAGVRFSWRPLTYGLALLLCLLAVLMLHKLGKKRIIGFLGVFFFLGTLLAGNAAHPVLPPNGEYRVTATLTQDAAIRPNGSAAVYLTDAELRQGDFMYRLPGLYWTYTPKDDQPFLPKEGDCVSFTGRVYAPNGQMNSYGFDFRMQLLQRGAAMGVTGCRDAAIKGHPGRGLRSLTYACQQALSEKADAVFGPDQTLPKALLLGDRQDVPQEVTKGFQNAGVAHLLAVSGLHVALLTEALMLPIRRRISRKWGLVIEAAFLLLYCALLNFSAPVVRASLLLVFARLRRLVRRQPDALTTLAAAFLLILLIRPLDLFAAGFQLSFSAVLGIALLSPEIERRFPVLQSSRLLRSLSGTLTASLGAALPTIQIFHRISPLGIFLTPLACAAFTVMLPWGALALTAGCIYLPVGQVLAKPLCLVFDGFASLVQALSKWPFARFRVPFLPWYCLMAVVIALLLATRFTVWKKKPKLIAALSVLAVAFSLWRITLNRHVQYVQLNAGQADCALVLDGKDTVLMDAGQNGNDAASFLLSTGRNADQVVLTHLHSDHCLGLQQLMEREIPIGCVYLPQGALEQQIDEACRELLSELQKEGVPIVFLSAGDKVTTEHTQMEVTWPIGGSVKANQEANRFCLTGLWDLDGVKLLATGDLAGDYEMYAARDADILKVAHHGSKNSTGADFLRIVTPDAALITGSGNESAALPSADTLQRLIDRGIPWYDTGRCGAVTLTIRDGQATLSTFLKETP